jgi:hypothetical protein
MNEHKDINFIKDLTFGILKGLSQSQGVTKIKNIARQKHDN